MTMAIQIPTASTPPTPASWWGRPPAHAAYMARSASAGDWGLKKGCAVALTDAGKGMGLYDLGDDTVNRIDGTRATRAGTFGALAANITDTARAAYNALCSPTAWRSSTPLADEP